VVGLTQIDEERVEPIRTAIFSTGFTGRMHFDIPAPNPMKAAAC